MACDGSCEHATKAKNASKQLEDAKNSLEANAKAMGRVAEKVGLKADAECAAVSLAVVERLERLAAVEAKQREAHAVLAKEAAKLAVKSGAKGTESEVAKGYEAWQPEALEQHHALLVRHAGARKGGDNGRFGSESDAQPERKSVGFPTTGADGKRTWS